ncbi:NAD(P)/FAD-dependent oxidoreductase [Lentilactobacillus kosonis]|uniref:NADH peroxidase Npx n=1 Tax=Lentilactobacillus kosonis TaxID=2810561 RepID=A0A401FI29_9LACO|nr:FAD-dependent oxidoreductase [Lentilactobacillus kosonis]GAY71911.1 NADH peroxidase Npx [Lentilactobacillus kosonis]
MKIIVVGASHGGQAAIEGIINQSNVEVKWYDQGNIADSLRLSLDDAERRFAELANQGVRTFSYYQAVKLLTDQKTLRVTNIQTGQEQDEQYDKLILATGASPSKLPVPGAELNGILTLRDAQSLMQFRKSATDENIKNIVVVGAGYIGIGAVSLFAQAGKKVTVIDSGDRILGTYLDHEFTDVISKSLIEKNVSIQTTERLTKFVGSDDQVVGIETDQGTYPADLVIMSIGAKPNTNWLAGEIELESNGLVKTNEFQQTSNSDVFAVGDITKLRYNPGDTDMNISLASNARRQGYLAAQNLTEPMQAFSGTQELRPGMFLITNLARLA